MSFAKWLSAIALIGSLGGVAYFTYVEPVHLPRNPPLRSFDPDRGYRYRNLSAPGNSDELFIILTFSGGGTRAAAFSYGVMRQLKATQIEHKGQTESLLDEVDVISSVSGGSFTAAYYAAFKDGLFATFEERFLKQDIDNRLLKYTLAPWNLIRIISSTFNTTDLASEFYDQYIFDQVTYSDLIDKAERPYIILNATDLRLGMPFQFTQEYFDLLYSNLASMPLGWAVAASSAIPPLFSPIPLRNYIARPDFAEPVWIEATLKDRYHADTNRFDQARQARRYSNANEHPFIHLVDGAISDNLGIRPVLSSLTTLVDGWSLFGMLNRAMVKHVVIIIVDSQHELIFPWANGPETPSDFDVMLAAALGLLDSNMLETSMLVRASAEEMRSRHNVDLQVIELSFAQIEDESERRFFTDLPTTFTLPTETIDRLIEKGAQLLADSPDYQNLVSSLREAVNPPKQ